ncbi:T5orf172 domain-containing protein [Shimia isoporae]|uniref:T5orf172 domain-containing protein n=1 Tax=Shimia isoporae TaxID=647720 RepID=A0A4R1N4L4_9RHOB|nr:GIY-YIG nuclease family protein [Shimia isoporae]TCK99004.1 T5orf172 domain-containing protein [Shimia isoporae]
MAGFDPNTDIRKDGKNYWLKVTPGRLETFLTYYIEGGDMAGKNVGTAERFLASLEYIAGRQLTNSKLLTTCDVYVIQGPGAVKIGIAADCEDRLRRLQTAFHDQLVLKKKWTFKDRKTAHSIEQNAHAEFKPQRQNGEWFLISAEEAIEAIERLKEEVAS